MIGNPHFDALVEAAPENFDRAHVEWTGIATLLQQKDIDPSTVIAVSWSTFSLANIEANIDGPGLAMVHPDGILWSTGKRKSFSKALKHHEISFAQCYTYGPTEHMDDRGFGKYCIDFAGPGGILLGRLYWRWSLKRFRDNRTEVMAAALERDRINLLVAVFLG